MSILTLTNVSKTFFPGTLNEKKALNGVNLSLERGEFVCVIGSNGAGKSTLFNAIGGTFFIDSGSIVLDGKNITGLPDHKRARNIGRIFQDPMKGTAPNMTIEENLCLAYSRKSARTFFALNRANREYFREILSVLELGLEDRMKTKVGHLSGGQRQAVSLLMSTISDPQLLLLDEHTAALDPATAKKVMDITKQLVAEKNITTMMITHDINAALKTGTRTIMLDDGKIVLDISGKVREEMTVPKLLELYSAESKKQFANDRMLFT